MKHKAIQKYNVWSIIFLLSIILEVLLFSFWKNAFGVYISPIIILLNNFLLLFSAFKIKSNNTSSGFKFDGQKNDKILYLIYATAAILIGFLMHHVYSQTPITQEISDIIPTLQKYNTRLLNGEFPYKPIQYNGWVVIPNYLPLQWLPFIVAEVLNFDYRWIAYIAFVMVNFFYWKERIAQNSFAENLLKAIIPFAFLFMIYQRDALIFGSNVELLLAAYYLFLALSIKSKNFLFIAIGILFCLLSRFSLLFWLPLYFYLLYKRENFKFILKVGLSVFVGVLIIYAIPFMSQDPFVFFKGLKYYSSAAVGEWLIKSFQSKGDIPFHLGKGIGFAVYFYEFALGSIEEKLNLAKLFHVAISIFTVLVSFLFLKSKTISTPLSFVILLSFKLYLAIFYAFIHIPYLYLQLVPLFISCAILYEMTLFPKKNIKQ